MKTLTRLGENRSSVVLSSPNDVRQLYKKVISEFQDELKEKEKKIIESASEKKMSLKRCEVCPLYESELSRFRESYQ